MRRFKLTGEIRVPKKGEYYYGINGPMKCCTQYNPEFPILQLEDYPALVFDVNAKKITNSYKTYSSHDEAKADFSGLYYSFIHWPAHEVKFPEAFNE